MTGGLTSHINALASRPAPSPVSAPSDTERLDWLIDEACMGANAGEMEPNEVVLVLGRKVGFPDGVRAAIDECRAARTASPETSDE